MHKPLAHVSVSVYRNDMHNGGIMCKALREVATIVTLAALIGTPIGLWYVGAI